MDLPLLTADLPGSGGGIVELSDFQVEEIPAYAPCGSGEHCFALVEKRGLTTPVAVRRLCAALRIDERAVGYAGLKDRHGITRQWISLPGVDPAAVLEIQQPELRVLQAQRHRNKLRTGHLAGNRFRVLLRDSAPGALEHARAVLERLAELGLPNYFGAQRFGREGDNAEHGLRLLRGELVLRDRVRRRLLVSALQSALFNEVLAARLARDALGCLLGGEVLQRTDSGGLFVSDPAARETDEARLRAGELVITGPICGPRMPLPAPDSPARAEEQRVFDRRGLAPADFAALGRISRGGRRPLTAPIRGATVQQTAEGLSLHFTLPPGAYATVLLREVTKSER